VTPRLPQGNTRLIVGVVIAILVLLIAWRWLGSRAPAAAKLPPAIAVDLATITRADVPVYLEGLGTVQAFYTDTMTARVDGQIEKVAFKEGQDVKKGALLVQIDPRPYQAALGIAIATRDKDKALLANAHRDMDRYALLAPEDLASKQTVDTQRALVEQIAAQIKVDQAVIDNARTQLDYTRIVSPIDGRTGIRLIDPGNIVHAAATTGIVVVTQMQPISVVFTLPEEQLAAVQRALASGPVKVATVAREGGAVLDEGTLSLIDNQIDQTTGSVRLKATFDNAHNTLWPGQYVDARVLVRTERDVLTIPDGAVQLGPAGPFTYVVKPDSTVEVRPLHVAESANGITIVTAGLAQGERVVTSNQYRLQPGSHVHDSATASSDEAASARAAPAAVAPTGAAGRHAAS